MSTFSRRSRFAAPLLVAGLLALLTSGCAGPSPDEAWQRDMDAANQLFRQGRYAEAEASYRAVAKTAEAFGPKDLRLATTLNNLAAVLDAAGQGSEAETLYKRVVEIREAALGPKDPLVARSLNNLAAFYGFDPQAGPVTALLERALDLRRNAPGVDPADVAQSWENLGLSAFVDGRDADAEKSFRESLALRERVGATGPETALTLASLGFTVLAQGRTAEAQELVKKAQSNLPGPPAMLISAVLVESGHPDRVIRIGNVPIGIAEPLVRRRWVQARRVLGMKSPAGIQAGAELAALLRYTDRMHEAAAIEARFRAEGVTLPEVAFAPPAGLAAPAPATAAPPASAATTR